jgi:hypothetical protein
MKTVVIKVSRPTPDNINHAIWKARDKMERDKCDGYRVEGPDGVVLKEGKRK